MFFPRANPQSEDTNTVQIDLRSDANRKRDGEISRIIGEMNLAGTGNPDQVNNDDDEDLLSLMDKAS
jgi:hypothetical protein